MLTWQLSSNQGVSENDLLAGMGAVNQPGKMRLGIMTIDDTGHGQKSQSMS